MRPTRRHIRFSTGCLRCSGAPRRPASGSVLSLHVPSRHVALYDPGEFIGCKYPVLGRQHWPSPSLNRLGTPKYPTIRFRWVLVFRGFTGSHRYDLSSGSPPWRIRPGISRPTEAFTPWLPSGRSPSPTPGITTVVTGQSPPAGLSPAGTAASVAALSDTRCSTYLIFTAFFASGGVRGSNPLTSTIFCADCKALTKF